MKAVLKKSVFRHVEDGIGKMVETNMSTLTFSTIQTIKLFINWNER
jgi:hypothetical protein